MLEISPSLTELQEIASQLPDRIPYLKESMSLEDYLDSFDHKTISERIMELIAQAVVDINEHILTRDLNVVVDSNRDSFFQAGQYRIITN